MEAVQWIRSWFYQPTEQVEEKVQDTVDDTQDKSDHPSHSSNTDVPQSMLSDGWQKFEKFESHTYQADIRNDEHILSEDRRKVLEKNNKTLKRLINLEETIILDELLSKDVITQTDKDVIRSQQGNDTQVGKLLEILQRKSNHQFDLFCNALDIAGYKAVVYDCLLTPSDLDVARGRLCSFLDQHYTDIHLYTSSREANPVPIQKLYVSMQWDMQSSDDPERKSKSSNSPDLMDYVSRVERSSDTRFVVTGEPGAGKTTAVKKICEIWTKGEDSPVKKYKEKRKEESVKHLLSSYLLVVPIILRSVTSGSSLLEIMSSQITMFTILDLLAIQKCMEIFPKKCLFIMDGFDEFRDNKTIFNMIKGLQHSKVKLILTSRPHGVSVLKHLGSIAVKRIANIIGFGSQQIREYIRQFFKLQKDIEKGERLIIFLETKKPSLLELAKIPIRLEMMCILWNDQEQLGELPVDLYIRFVQYLLDHMEKKEMYERTPEAMITDKYQGLLMQMANLANNFDENGRIKTIVPYKDLQKLCTKQAIELGCLVKYNPTSNLELSEWQFTHLSVQEFFIAFFLANTNSEPDILTYINRCSSIGKLEKQQVVLSFLCGLNPDRANKIMIEVIKKITDESDCKRLLVFLRKLVPNFRNRKDVRFPLPHIVDVKDIQNIEACLFSSDALYHKNMKTLIISNITNKIYLNSLKYVQRLTIIDKESIWWHNKHGVSNSDMTSIGEELENLTTIQILSDHRDYTSLLRGLPAGNVQKIIIDVVASFAKIDATLSRFSNLEELVIRDPNVECDKLQSLCNSVKDVSSLKAVQIESSGFPTVVCDFNDRVSIKLKVRKINAEQAERFANKLMENHENKNSTMINEFDLSNNDLNAGGKILASILLSGPKMVKYTILLYVLMIALNLGNILFLNQYNVYMLIFCTCLLVIFRLLPSQPAKNLSETLAYAIAAVAFSVETYTSVSGIEYLICISITLALSIFVVQKIRTTNVLNNLLTLWKNVSISSFCIGLLVFYLSSNCHNVIYAHLVYTICICVTLGASFFDWFLTTPGLQKLNLTSCNMTAATLKQVADILSEHHKLIQLQELLLRNNKINEAGTHLAAILEFTEHLQSLDLCQTNFNEEDVGAIVQKRDLSFVKKIIKGSKRVECNVKQLCINPDNIRSHQLLHIFNLSNQFNVLVIQANSSYIWNDIPQCLSAKSASHLTVFAVENLEFFGVYFEEFIFNLPLTLEVLGIIHCNIKGESNLKLLFSRLPPNIKHLNLYGNDFGVSIIGLKNHKAMTRLNYLHKLNIGNKGDKDFVEALRIELQETNPDLQVYCDKDEDIWQMYKEDVSNRQELTPDILMLFVLILLSLVSVCMFWYHYYISH